MLVVVLAANAAHVVLASIRGASAGVVPAPDRVPAGVNETAKKIRGGAQLGLHWASIPLATLTIDRQSLTLHTVFRGRTIARSELDAVERKFLGSIRFVRRDHPREILLFTPWNRQCLFDALVEFGWLAPPPPDLPAATE